MNEIAFRNWMVSRGKSKKVISDTVSRLKKIERELGHIDLDEEYKKDQFSHLIKLFDNIGRNERMQRINPDLPIGKYYLSTFKYAIRLYMAYNDFSNASRSQAS